MPDSSSLWRQRRKGLSLPGLGWGGVALKGNFWAVVTGDLGFDRWLGVHQEESIIQKEHLHEPVEEGKQGNWEHWRDVLRGVESGWNGLHPWPRRKGAGSRNSFRKPDQVPIKESGLSIFIKLPSWIVWHKIILAFGYEEEYLDIKCVILQEFLPLKLSSAFFMIFFIKNKTPQL